MRRRKFLRLAGIGTLVAYSFVDGCYRSSTEQLEEFLSFPDKIPGADRVEKFPGSGSNYCLVHIRQMHHIDYNPNDPIDRILGIHKPTKKELERINSHQRNIYEIISYLKQTGVANSVYLEGIDKSLLERIRKISLIPENEELTGELEDLEQKLNQKIIWNVPEGYTPEKLMREYSQKLEDIKKRVKDHNEKYKYFYGGGLRLVLEGKIEPRFEDFIVYNRANEELEKTHKLGFDAFDGREDAILECIAQGNERLAVVEFGGIHSWGGKKSCGEHYNFYGRKSYKDNLAEWNKQHPNKKFCLIEVTPRGYEE